MKLEFKAIGVKLSDVKITDDSKHPNKMPFDGTLLVLDEPSDQAPHGSQGHRIMVTRAQAQKRLDSLIGMPLNYAADFDGHNSNEPVGVILKSWIEGNKVRVQGFVWKNNFPQAERDLKGRRLGMSMELADVVVKNKNADVWRLDDFYFVGATALWPESAAYHTTSLAASRDLSISEALVAAAAALGLGGTMPSGSGKPEKKKVAAEKDQGRLLVDAITAGIVKANAPLLAEIRTLSTEVKSMKASAPKEKTDEEKAQEELEAALTTVDVEAEADDEDDSDEEIDVDAAAKKKKDSQQEEDTEPSDNPDEEDMEMESEAEVEAESEPAVTAAAAPKVNVSTLKAAANQIRSMKAQIGKLTSSLKSEKRARKEQQNRMDAMESQLELYAGRVERKTLTPDLHAIMDKAGINVSGIQASQFKKLPVSKVDQILDNCGVTLDNQTRMYMKNQLEAAGVMDSGIVRPM